MRAAFSIKEFAERIPLDYRDSIGSAIRGSRRCLSIHGHQSSRFLDRKSGDPQDVGSAAGGKDAGSGRAGGV